MSDLERGMRLVFLVVGMLATACAPTKGPEAARLASRRGEQEMERGNFQTAEAELKRAIELEPRSTDARRRLIFLFAQQGRAREVAEESRAMAGVTNLGFLDLVMWTLARHPPLDLEEVARALGRAISKDAGDRKSRLALAEILRRLGRLDDADSTLAVFSPTDREARAARARIELDRGNGAGAETVLGGDSSGHDEEAAAGELRGRLALGRGDAAAAIRHFQAALRNSPGDRDAEFGLSQALRLAGELEAARPHAESARAQDRLEWLVQSARAPDRRTDPKTLQEIAAACLALGRRDEARAWYRLAIRQAPDNAELRKALAELDRVPGG